MILYVLKRAVCNAVFTVIRVCDWWLAVSPLIGAPALVVVVDFWLAHWRWLEDDSLPPGRWCSREACVARVLLVSALAAFSTRSLMSAYRYPRRRHGQRRDRNTDVVRRRVSPEPAIPGAKKNSWRPRQSLTLQWDFDRNEPPPHQCRWALISRYMLLRALLMSIGRCRSSARPCHSAVSRCSYCTSAAGRYFWCSAVVSLRSLCRWSLLLAYKSTQLGRPIVTKRVKSVIELLTLAAVSLSLSSKSNASSRLMLQCPGGWVAVLDAMRARACEKGWCILGCRTAWEIATSLSSLYRTEKKYSQF